MAKDYRGQRKLSELLEIAATPAAKKHGFAIFKIVSNWPNIVGVFLATHSTPKGVQFPGNNASNGVLQITVENPGFSLELQASERIIIQKISAFFGYQAVDRIKVEIARTRKPFIPLKDSIAPIKSPLSDIEIEKVVSSLKKIEDLNLREILASISENSFSSD